MLFCSRCGAQVVPGSASCRACGAPITPTVDTPDLLKRPALVTLLAVLQFIGAAIFLLAALGFGASAMGEGRDTESVLILALLAGFGLVQLVCGIGLWQLQRYGRTLQLVLAVIGLLGIPLGTIISICILVYLTKPGIKVLFSGKTAAELTPTERSAIAVLSRSSTATTVLIVVVVVLFPSPSLASSPQSPSLACSELECRATKRQPSERYARWSPPRFHIRRPMAASSTRQNA